MIIDVHTHTFPDSIVASTIKALSDAAHMTPSSDGTREGLIASMDRGGVDISVECAVATKPSQVPKLNSIAVKEAGKKDRIIVFGSAHPDFEDNDLQLEQLAKAGVLGIKVHPVYQRTLLDDEKYLRIFRRCAKLGLIVLAHVGFDIGFPGEDWCGSERIRSVMDAVPDVTFIAAHMGGWLKWDNVIKDLADTPVYLDTAFTLGSIVPQPGQEQWVLDNMGRVDLLKGEDFVSIVKAFGADRILFGTDSPWRDHKQSLDAIRDLGLDPLEEEAIFGANAARLMGI